MGDIPPLPEAVIIDVLDACNLSCSLCPTGASMPSQKRSAMSLANFERLLDQMPQLKVVHIFNWGEPLLHPQIHEIIWAATHRDVATVAHSNLSFKRGLDFFRALVKSGLTGLVASIDGATQEGYEAYRRGGNFAWTQENLASLKQAKREQRSRTPRLLWKFLVNRHNEHEVDVAREQAKALGVPFTTSPMGIGGEMVDWQPDGTLQERAEAWLPTSSDYWSDNMKRGVLGADAHGAPHDALGHCAWPRKQLVINPRGMVLPCAFATRDSSAFGNVFESSILEVWGNENYRYARSLRRGHPPDRKDAKGAIICEQCPVVSSELVQLRTRPPR